MGIDASIYSQQQATPDIMGSIANAMKLKDMVRQNQIADRAQNFQNTLRTAYQVDPTTGAVAFNPSKMGDLVNIDPVAANQFAVQQQQQKLQRQQMDLKTMNDKLDLAGKVGGTVSNPQQADSARSLLMAHGFDQSELPQTADPKDWQDFASHSMTYKDKLTAQAAKQTADAKTTEANVAAAKFPLYQKEVQAKIEGNQLERSRQGQRDQSMALQQTQQMLESARGNPAVSTAQRDMYAAQKLNSLLGSDPNKASPQMVQLAASEVAKIAQGGVPQSSELQHLTPSSIPSSLASMAQYVSNNPQSAQAGAFLKQYQDYANKVSGDAKSVIKDKYSRVLESKKRVLNPADYDTLKSNYLDPLGGDTRAGAHPVDNMSDDQVRAAYQQMQAAKSAGGSR